MQQQTPIPIQANLHIIRNNGLPRIEIRRALQKKEVIRLVLSAAIQERPVLIMPVFRSKLEAINSLIDSGIMYREGDRIGFLE